MEQTLNISREDWIKAIKTLRRYTLHRCSICGYPCSFNYYEGEQLHYDSGCDCTGYSNNHPCPESALDFYLKPSHGHLDNIQKFIDEANLKGK